MSESPLPDSELRWFACHAKPRCEKKLANALRVDGLEHYLPLVDSVRQYGNRAKRFSKPLFPGYLFARLHPGLPLRTEQLAQLVRMLPVDDEARFLEQLDAIRRMIASGLTLTLQPMLKKGSHVRISGGPLWGLEGVVDNPVNPKGVIIAVDILQQVVHVTIPPEYLKVL